MNPNRTEAHAQAQALAMPKKWDELGIEEKLEMLRTQIQARTAVNNDRFRDLYEQLAKLALHQHLPNGKAAIALDELRSLLLSLGGVAGSRDPLA